MPRSQKVSRALAGVALVLGCSGQIGSSSRRGGGSDEPPPGPGNTGARGGGAGVGSYLLMADGTIRTSGNAVDSGSKVFSNTKPSVTQVAEIATGAPGVVCLRKTDGSIACMGFNQNGAVGPGIALGDFSSTPVAVPLPGPASAIAVGGNPLDGDFACAIVAVAGGAQIFCWGDNKHGQFGNG
jgi:hypothetical protein